MSQRGPCGRLTPRWSVAGHPLLALVRPASMAGLPGRSARVSVGPPLSCSGPSRGLVLCLSVDFVKPQESSLLTLLPCEETPMEPGSFAQSSSELPATMEFNTRTLVPKALETPPPCRPDVLEVMVEFRIDI